MVATNQTEILTILSSVLGWMYFMAWSVSFYPQSILNYKRKSVHGLSIDFLYLNVLGFACYAVYNLLFYFDIDIKNEYRATHDGQDSLVMLNDVVFSAHSLVMSSVLLIQSFIYKRERTQKMSSMCFWIIFAVFASLAISYLRFTRIVTLYIISYTKLLCTILKYIPQAYINYQRKSTIGWSIHNILFDVTGGFLSCTQLFLDALNAGSLGYIQNNLVKLILGLISIMFDLVFIVQHFVLYKHSNSPSHIQEETLETDGYTRTYSEDSVEIEDDVPRKHI